jgi:hypothetical protein
VAGDAHYDERLTEDVMSVARRISIVFGCFMTLALMVSAMIALSRSLRWSEAATHPDVVLWACRCAALALAAAAQVLAMSTVASPIIQRLSRPADELIIVKPDALGRLFTRGFALICAAATVSAAPLGLAGR